MDVPTMTMDKEKAAQLAAEYRESVQKRVAKQRAAIANKRRRLDETEERLLAEDKALLAGYEALATGRQVIDLTLAIKGGGVHDDGLPKLAACSSDATWCWVVRRDNGDVVFTGWEPRWSQRSVGRIELEQVLPTCRELGHDSRFGSYHRQHNKPHVGWSGDMRALVPSVPAPLRPAHHLRNYVTLFEVPKWEKAPRPPGDPLLLKHLHGHLYAVVAQWDLTELEKAVLAGRT